MFAAATGKSAKGAEHSENEAGTGNADAALPPGNPGPRAAARVRWWPQATEPASPGASIQPAGTVPRCPLATREALGLPPRAA